LSGLLRVNGSVAYIKLGRFEEAIVCLNEVKNQKLLGKQVNLVYAINMCMALLGAGKVQEATDLFEQSEGLLKQFREDVQYREAVNSLYYEFERLKTIR
ncbi:MAG: hypothetical protein HUJ58_06440, partial [Erysipelotrichaceae bacterium]|nr:hypothetical protein [Erysipelotrichaceae bacterium]